MVEANRNLAALAVTKAEYVETQNQMAEAVRMEADMKILAANPAEMDPLARAMHAQLLKNVMARRFPNGLPDN